ncbi:MAG TPA: hypothetical protein VGS27_05245 [Candidatus Sulfotelmatobacter sp.]|nr:hypothetical protein [Candidatus Sulfotelmatobacter sp.]
MKARGTSPSLAPQVTIRVSGKLFEGHLSYLDQLVQSAAECRLWPMLNLASLEEIDQCALSYLIEGEGQSFGIVACPEFIRERMERQKQKAA